MRPIKLSMTAFGPFVNTETINFDAFGDKSLFLINGATGSGKTTILDAICFALYGQTTGKEREATQMRCDYANDKTLTQVEFTFELRGDKYRILRIPEQLRAKTKGSGTTRQNPVATLWQLEGETKNLLIPRKVFEATKKIEELTGLRVDQFRQVMILPQGQFRQLLMADSKDREQIFSQLFETHVYKKIEDKLKRLAGEINKKIQTLKEKQQGVLQNVELDNIGELDKAMTMLAPQYNEAKAKKEKMVHRYVQRVKDEKEAQLLAEDFSRLASQKEKLTELKQQKIKITAKKKKQKQAELALKIKPLFTELLRCRDEVKNVFTQLEKSTKEYKLKKTSLKKAKHALKENKQRKYKLDEQKSTLTRLKSYQERVTKLQQAQANLKKIRMQYQSNEKRLKQAENDLEQTSQQLEKYETEKKYLEQILSTETDVYVEQQKISELLKQKEVYDNLLAKEKEIQQTFQQVVSKNKELVNNFDNKAKKSKKIELDWHNGQATILAGELLQDQPCPVCGSLKHPQPAHIEKSIPTEKERETAQKNVENARNLVQKKRDEHMKLESELEGLSKQITEQQQLLDENTNTSLNEIEERCVILNKQLDQYKIQKKQLKDLDDDIGNSKQKARCERENVEELNKKQAEIGAQLARRKAIVEEAEKELPKLYRESGQLESSISQIEENIQQLENRIQQIYKNYTNSSKENAEANARVNDLEENHTRLQRSEKKALNQWKKSIEKSIFKDESDYQQAYCDDKELEALKLEINEFDSEYQQTQGAFNDQQKMLKNKKKPDLQALQVLLQQAAEDKKESEQNWKQLDRQQDRYHRARQTLSNITKEQKIEDGQYKIIGTLSDVANGTRGNKISLQRFVLSVLLDDVLIEASHRLKVMSNERYSLLRKEERAKGNKASGLELEVEDSYTGKIRAVTTLSGGETFMASLSLALGLSDVVQAYAGGIRLDTLFIDEGFGSLDADSLDLAIRTLSDLRDTGRMVGIISHVAELKEQMELRLDVIGGRNGSSIQLVQ